MRTILALMLATACCSWAWAADEESHADEIRRWQAERENKLRADNGWLTLVGRYTLNDGDNTIGTAKSNDVVFPEALDGTGPPRLGSVHVDATAKQVTLRLADGVSMTSGDAAFSGQRVLGTDPSKRDWVGLGRLQMHVIQHQGKYILRLADNESPLRRDFPGCLWYEPNAALRVAARFVPYAEGKTLPIVNVLDEVSHQPCPGYAEFELNGQLHRLDAIAEGDGLFFVFRDATAGDTTYPPARFIDIEKRPPDHATFTLDFNKAYNPPCAFSAYTSCPLPPKQNILPVRIEAGERYRGRK